MKALLKNPWTWLLILFLALSVGMGMFLFREKSTVTMSKEEARQPAGSNEQEEKISKEDSEDIVKKLEAGNGVPEEKEEEGVINEQGTEDNEQVRQPAEGSKEQRTMSKEQGAGNMEQEEIVEGDVKITDRLVSWGFQKANDRNVDTVVVHSTYNALGGDPFSVSKIIDIYKSYGVSPHYLVARDGTVYRMVDEKNIAYHAGDSEMPDGRSNVNAFSIGIEVIGKDDGSPSDAQYDALKKLIADIETRRTIKHILGHSDIAPGRKSDPWGFNWKKIGGKEL